MILVRFLNLVLPYELATPNDRKFKFTALVAPIPKFASVCGTLCDANFGIKGALSNFMILVRFLNLKLLYELATPNDRKFKFTALVRQPQFFLRAIIPN